MSMQPSWSVTSHATQRSDRAPGRNPLGHRPPSGETAPEGALETDTAFERVGAGRYRATLSGEGGIGGPMGGYEAAVARRAAGAESPFPGRPASAASTSVWPPSSR